MMTISKSKCIKIICIAGVALGAVAICQPKQMSEHGTDITAYVRDALHTLEKKMACLSLQPTAAAFKRKK